MLDKIIEKFLDFFINSDVIQSMKRNEFMEDFVQKLEDTKFMTHIIKYLIFGVLTTIISLGSFWLLLKTNLNENICNFLSIVIGIVSAYVLNRNYVFESKEKNIAKEFSKFVMARAASSLFDMVAFFIFATCLSLNEMVVKVIISIVVIVLNYILSKLIVFNKKENT